MTTYDQYAGGDLICRYWDGAAGDYTVHRVRYIDGDSEFYRVYHLGEMVFKGNAGDSEKFFNRICENI